MVEVQQKWATVCVGSFPLDQSQCSLIASYTLTYFYSEMVSTESRFDINYKTCRLIIVLVLCSTRLTYVLFLDTASTGGHNVKMIHLFLMR